MEKLGPYLMCIAVSLMYAGFTIVSKICLDKGINTYVLVVYSYGLGSLTCIFLTLLFERKNNCKFTYQVSIGILISGLIASSSHLFFYLGLKSSSPAFASAITNLIPSFTFLLAILLRMEKLKIKSLSNQAKVIGTLVAFGGAAVMALYKGKAVVSPNLPHYSTKNASKAAVHEDLFKGLVFLLLHCITTASFYLYQAIIVEKYPAPIRLTAMTSAVGAMEAAVVAAIVDHKSSSWKYANDITLLAPIYIGIMVTGITVFLQILAIRKTNPVFVSSFRPLSTLVAVIMGIFILGDKLYLGIILGGILIVFGLYAFLWGSEKEKKKNLSPEISAVNDEENRTDQNGQLDNNITQEK